MIKQKRFLILVLCAILNIALWVLFINSSRSAILPVQIQETQKEEIFPLNLKEIQEELNKDRKMDSSDEAVQRRSSSFQPSEEMLNLARKTLGREKLSFDENEKYNKIMSSSKSRNELRMTIKFIEDERRNSMFERKASSNIDPLKKELMEQLPTVFVTGAKKCGTKALIRFFGHHPQVIHGFMESPYHDTGNPTFDVKSYLNHVWLMWKQKNDIVDNIAKIHRLQEQQKKIHFFGKTANSGIKKIINFIQSEENFIHQSYIDSWLDDLKVIFIVCDPVKRLLSDFKHVMASWAEKSHAVNRMFLGSESSAYPFQNMTFNSMVEKYLPMVRDRQEEYKKHKDVFEMFGIGRFSAVNTSFSNGPNEFGIYKQAPFIFDGQELKTQPWKLFQRLEKYLGVESFFEEANFARREDGFYCVRMENEELDCLPPSKGRSSNDTELYSISKSTQSMLEDFYFSTNQKVAEKFNVSMSWLNTS